MEGHLSAPASPPSAPPVIDRRRMPLGVLPRHLPQGVLAGIALVMVAILAMTGGPPKPRQSATSPSPGAAALDPNQQRIEAYQQRIQEEAERLAHEQTALARAKSGVGGAPAWTGGSPLGAVERAAKGSDSGSASASPVSRGSTTASLEQDRLQREYRSLFADNVAFSRDRARDDPRAVAIPAAVQAPADATSPLLPSPAAAAWPSATVPPMNGLAESAVRPALAPSPPESGASGPRDVPAAAGSRHGSTPVPPGLSAAASSHEVTYRLPEGTIVETVLTNRLDGTFAGPVNCLVTTTVYAADAQQLVIPAGSRVLGEAKPLNTFGQSRLAVVFHRLALPNGTHVDLHDFHGLNQVGEIGLRDQVDRHYAQIFGASLAVGAIAGLAQAQTTVGLDATSLDVYRQGAAANLAQSSARILDRFLNLLPTVTIREGHRIKVYLSNDLELPAYHDTRPGGGGRP
jgi:type IV secretion system protein VirB10